MDLPSVDNRDSTYVYMQGRRLEEEKALDIILFMRDYCQGLSFQQFLEVVFLSGDETPQSATHKGYILQRWWTSEPSQYVEYMVGLEVKCGHNLPGLVHTVLVSGLSPSSHYERHYRGLV